MPRDGFCFQGYSLEHEKVPTLMELLFYWGTETINKQEVICNSERWRKESSQGIASKSDMRVPPIKKDGQQKASLKRLSLNIGEDKMGRRMEVALWWLGRKLCWWGNDKCKGPVVGGKNKLGMSEEEKRPLWLETHEGGEEIVLMW